ncbi:MAG: YbaN family protein [Nitrospirota bacterium]
MGESDGNTRRIPPRSVRQRLLTAVGMLATALGILGIFLPLLPTTPFLLLAAACFARSSDRSYQWLINHPWFGSYIRNYREHRAIPLRTKVTAITVLWSVIGYTAVYVVPLRWVSALLACVAGAVTIHLLSLRTLTPEMILPPATRRGDAPTNDRPIKRAA